MTSEQNRRLMMLKAGPCVPLGYIKDYYGLTWPCSDFANKAYNIYTNTLRHRISCTKEALSRYELEGFMSQNNMITKKWMAASLGMSEASLKVLLSKLDKFGMQPARYVIDDEFVSDSLSEDLTRHIPGLRFRTFGDHNFFCTRLHVELKKKINLQVEALYCTTSDHLQDYPRRFAANFDCLTLEPLSAKHSIWLDFQKPISLLPDRCSKLLYVKNRRKLKQWIAGSGEPEHLDEYEEPMGSAAHG